MESGKWAHCRGPRRGCQSRFHGLIRGEFNNPSGIKRATAISEASSLLSTPEAIMGLMKPELRASSTLVAVVATLLSTIAAVLYGMGLRSMLLAASSPGGGRWSV
jgi:hypothetical protein